MQCPHCYDQEETGFGFGQSKRVHLELERVACENGYAYYQCPCCTHTRKRKEGVFSRGVVEPVSIEEAVAAARSKKGSVLGTAAKVVGGIGLAALLIAAAGETEK